MPSQMKNLGISINESVIFYGKTIKRYYKPNFHHTSKTPFIANPKKEYNPKIHSCSLRIGTENAMEKVRKSLNFVILQYGYAVYNPHPYTVPKDKPKIVSQQYSV